MTILQARKFFHETFGANFNSFADMIFTTPECARINLIKFDEWLHDKFGDYEDEEKSMKDIIEEHFGNTACRKFMQLF